MPSMNRSTANPSGTSAASSASNTAPVAGVTLGAAISALASSTGSIGVVMNALYPFVSSEVESPIVIAQGRWASDRNNVAYGKSVSVSVDIGGRRLTQIDQVHRDNK